MNDSQYKPKPPQRRTEAQNRSYHKYFEEVADLLNESGISMSVLYECVEADHTKESVKGLFKSFAKAKYGKESTRDLTTKEVTVLYDEMNRHLAQFGLHVGFPSRGDWTDEQITNNGYMQ